MYLVSEQPFIVPSYSWWEGPFYGIGLKLYSMLSGKYGFGPSQIVSREETLRRLPNVKTEGLTGGGVYHDGQFDDSRLLINLVATAAEQEIGFMLKTAGLYLAKAPTRADILRNPQSKCHKGMKAILSIALSFLTSIGASSGVTLSFEVNSPKECGENIHLDTQPSRSDKGLISVSVTFTPTAPEPYRGRVKTIGKLVVKNGNETIAVSNLESTQKAGVFRFTFQLARYAFRNSELTLSSVLYEENGLATVGGGVKWLSHLRGFQPGEQPKAAPPNGGPATPPGNSGAAVGRHR